jgi:hypothetical protein
MKFIPWFLIENGKQYILHDLDGKDKKIEYLGSDVWGRNFRNVEEGETFSVPNDFVNKMKFGSID